MHYDKNSKLWFHNKGMGDILMRNRQDDNLFPFNGNDKKKENLTTGIGEK